MNPQDVAHLVTGKGIPHLSTAYLVPGGNLGSSADQRLEDFQMSPAAGPEQGGCLQLHQTKQKMLPKILLGPSPNFQTSQIPTLGG